MDLPSQRFTLTDRTTGVTFIVLGYRTPTGAEAVFAARSYLQNLGRKKKPKKGATVTVVTLIGLQD